MREEMEERAREFPDAPGVYWFIDEAGETIYVGKAVSLRRRIRSYFTSPRALNTRTMRMMNEAAGLDYLVTDNEVEALILESNLIKRHRPKYNIRLRDDKHYPYVMITTAEEYPRVQVVRRPREDGNRYFGPFTTSSALRQTLDVLRKVFPYRTCSNYRLQNTRRPCLHHQMGRCLGPCTDEVGEREYGEMIDDLLQFFSGREKELARELEQKMQEAARGLDFERAARYRDQVRALEHVRERQKMIYASSEEEQDIVGIAREENVACVTLLFMREGRVVGREHFRLPAEPDDADEEILDAVLREYYVDAHRVPKRIEVPALPSDSDTMSRWLSERRGSKVFLHRPQRGPRRRLVEMANTNAELHLREEGSRGDDAAGSQLAEVLQLPTAPHRLECYDVSNISGVAPVGSMVVFEGGIPARHAYRRFRIKGVRGPDDFAMLAEVLCRRLRRLNCGDGEDPSFSSRPDLIVVDGGKGQLSAVARIMAEAGHGDIPAVGLAKREERVYTTRDPEPLRLDAESPALQLLQRVRDEAHRFAVSYHRHLRRAESMRSLLEDIPGIGARRRNALLRSFDSLSSLAEATVEEIAQAPGMNLPVARRVKRFLKEQTDLQ